MQAEQLKERIARVEQCADDARKACRNASSLPADVKDSIARLHEQASAAKHASPGASEDSLRQDVMQIEASADRAMQACRSAGSSIDPQTQQAVQRAHAEVSSLKKELMQEA
jgi:hypothetical protein